jgi:polysaccharide biosynthesis protein PslG
MTKAVPPRPQSTASVLIGLWIGLTVVAGLGTFAVLFWAAGGFAAAPVPTAGLPPTVAVTVETSTPNLAEPKMEPTQAVSTACKYPAAPASGFGYGIQSHVFGGGDLSYFLSGVKELGLQWLKIQVRWNYLEQKQGEIDWTIMDTAMKVSCENGLHVMLSVVAGPPWTHASPMSGDNQAPPDDPQLYADFLTKILDRYPGQVGAIEVWNEENLEREWNTTEGINPDAYLKLLQIAYTTIKSKDPNVTVISGALSPTGINCNGSWPDCQGGRPIVVDDATYLTKLVQIGGLQYADCIGAHSNGTNLPPDSDGANPPGDGSNYSFKGPWQSPHYSWALRSQVETYAKILNNQKLICVTEFGYASPMGGKYPPNFAFAADVSEAQQADYLVKAFNWMRDSKKVKLAFLFNLDYGQLGSGDPSKDDNMLFSLLNMDGSPRPAFDAIKSMAKP